MLRPAQRSRKRNSAHSALRNTQKNCEDVTNFTVREALDKKIIRCEWQAFFMAMAKRLLTKSVSPWRSNGSSKNCHGKKPTTAAKASTKKSSLTVTGWTEVSGHAYRTDFDLTCHMKASGVDMRVYKEYATPVETEQLVVKANYGKAWSSLSRRKQAKCGELLAKVPAQQVV